MRKRFRIPWWGAAALLAAASLFGCGRRMDSVIADFEGGDYAEWIVTGSAFGTAPVGSVLEGQRMTGFLGRRFANGFHGGGASQGTLLSPEFTVVQPFINFLIAGSDRPSETCLNLLIDGEVARTATGVSTRYMVWKHWDVADLMGRTARIEVVDTSSARGGYVAVDHIVQSGRAYVRPDLEREVTIRKRYLNLPVKTWIHNRVMRVSLEGGLSQTFDIELAEEEPDFWAFMDLGGHIGEKAVIRVSQPWGSDPDVLDRLVQSDEIRDADSLYREKHRPQFHFTSRRGWNNDPNGLVFYDGEYHLFYQHNPYGWNWGNMHWGHAVSTDLVHWNELGDAIFPDALGTIFSGSAVVDWNDTAGFRAGDPHTIVCFYTSAGSHVEPRVLFTQSIAFSTDRGRTFTKYRGNPVIGHIIDANRDPKVIWDENNKQWIMALFLTGNDYTLFTSPDLKTWQRVGDVRIPGCSECPDIFRLAVDGEPGNTKWVFWGANGSYVLGTFDGAGFRPEGDAIRLYAGGTAYAAQSFSDIPESDGRRIQISWLRCAMPGMPFNQQMGFPVELTLRTTEEGVRMFAEPVNEIEAIRIKTHTWEAYELEPGDHPLASISGELFDIRLEVSVGTAGVFGIKIRGIPVVYNSAEHTLVCQDASAPLKPNNGRITLRILVDRASLEIFGNNGRMYLPIGLVLPGHDPPLELFAEGGAVQIHALQIHELQSIW